MLSAAPSHGSAAMPSTVLAEPLPSSTPDEHKKSKYKAKKPEPMAVDTILSDEEEKSEKKKKKKNKKKITDSDEEVVTTVDGDDEAKSDKKKEKKKKEKTRKASEGEKNDTSSDAAAEPLAKRAKKDEGPPSDGEVTVGSEEEEEEEDAGPNALSNFRISEVLREKLRSNGIKALFPIQAMTFDIILNGSDLVGRARTGQGKTLAFVLPILESLVNGLHKASRKTGYGRPPSVLVLLPTRELANQVYADFKLYGAALGLFACCMYGGSSYRDQERALKLGVDVVVGTPGRIKDHIERGTLNLKSLKFRVLDESDEMLNRGFVYDVEYILGKVEDLSKVQTLLFSATLPDWVKKLSARFLKPDKKVADLVGNEKLKASASVRHLVLPCSPAARSQIIPDIIRCYSRGGRTIIFTEKKESTSELAGLLSGARALHGDIVQAQREVILAGFRSGKFSVLVATNVAARGLDINDVQLIIQVEPPRDVEAYIHRSGRTGRAGNTGVAILLYEPKYSHSIFKIERESGVKFEHISAPQPVDVAESAGSGAAAAISNVSDSVVPVFRPQAEKLLSSSGLSALDLLAKALAMAAGYTDIKQRSLLASMENYVTLLIQNGQIMYSPTFAFSILRRFLPDEKIAGVMSLSLTADGMGAVFDVPADDVGLFIEGQKNAHMVNIEVLKNLPPLQDREQARGGSGGRGRFGGGGSSSFSGQRESGRFSNRGGNKRGRGFSRGGGCGKGNRGSRGH